MIVIVVAVVALALIVVFGLVRNTRVWWLSGGLLVGFGGVSIAASLQTEQHGDSAVVEAFGVLLGSVLGVVGLVLLLVGRATRRRAARLARSLD